MKFKKYLNENIEKKIFYILKNDCSEILKIYKDIQDFLYRGSSKPRLYYKKIYPHKNRNPRDINQFLTKYIDNYLNNKFGWKPRTEGVFVSFSRSTTTYYGYPYLFFPKDGFKYIWNLKIYDLLNYLTYGNYIPKENYNSWEELKKLREERRLKNKNIEEIKNELNLLLDGYKSNNIKNIYGYNNEIIFKCEYYYLVNISYSYSIMESIKNEI